jgi:CheY-like chemotaxis protein
MTVRKIMIVEDEFIVGLDLVETAQDLGFVTEGPYTTVREASEAVEATSPDAAILDVQLEDGEVYPLADRLTQMGVPIIFHSGHAHPQELARRYPGSLTCGKPCSPDTLITMLRQATG